ncbi:MAG TPA: hypothetical protein IAB61_01790 [Candidatus Merdisoma merdipullorum]|nr:hypothetical protein [Candidatus Merdisoma merdipullorum]
MTSKEQAETIFRNIPLGKEKAIQRPDNKSVDRELRDLISKANTKGALIINVGGGIYVARPWEPEERKECEEYIAKERSRAFQLLEKVSHMEKTLEATRPEQLKLAEFLGW